MVQLLRLLLVQLLAQLMVKHLHQHMPQNTWTILLSSVAISIAQHGPLGGSFGLQQLEQLYKLCRFVCKPWRARGALGSPPCSILFA